jgi:hypothetical protein
MSVDVAASLAGLFFWLVIVTNIASNGLGYQTFGKLDTEAPLDEIAAAPGRFKASVWLIVIEHLCIAGIAVFLFIAFDELNMALAIVWLVSRGIEAAMQIVEKRKYWGLLDVARRYSGVMNGQRSALAERRVTILESKQTNFLRAQILFAIGTFSYSLVFATEAVVPAPLAWFGVAAAILYGLGNALMLRNSESMGLWGAAGLGILVYETLLGGWLLFG